MNNYFICNVIFMIENVFYMRIVASFWVVWADFKVWELMEVVFWLCRRCWDVNWNLLLFVIFIAGYDLIYCTWW